MKRDVSIRLRDRTTDGHSRAFIEGHLADHQRRSPTSLLMARLRIKIQRYQITLFGNVRGHLPDLTPRRLTEKLL